MKKWNSLRQLIKGTKHDTHHENNPRRNSPKYAVMGCNWPMQNVKCGQYPYYDKENPAVCKWNQASTSNRMEGMCQRHGNNETPTFLF